MEHDKQYDLLFSSKNEIAEADVTGFDFMTGTIGEFALGVRVTRI